MRKKLNETLIPIEESVMGETRRELFTVIIQSALARTGVTTAHERDEIYSYAWRTIEEAVAERPVADERDIAAIRSDIELAIAHVETRRVKFSCQLDVAPPVASSLVPVIDFIDTNEGPPPQLAGSKAFLKNIGAGSATSLVKIAVQLVLLPVMAHLLGPNEFGLYAMAAPIVAFLAMIADGGVGLSLAKDRTNSPAVWSTAFWILLISGLSLAIVINIIGYFLAKSSAEPRLFILMAILSIGFPFVTGSILPTARLMRSGNMVPYAISDLAATLVGATCAVVLGYLGYGAISLACQYAAGPITRAIILNSIAFERPLLVFKLATLKSHLSSGGILMSGRVADLICRSIENLVFGNAFGSATLGAYNFANQVPRFLFEAFSNPSWSALYTQSISDETAKTLSIFYKVCRFMAFVTFPAAGILAASSPDVMRHVLGEKWVQSGLFLQVLAPGYALTSVVSMGTAILLSVNANKSYFFLILGLASARVIAALVGFFLAPWETVLLVTLANIVYTIVLLLCLRNFTNVKIFRFFSAIFPSFLSSCLCGVACFLILEVFGRNLAIIVVDIAAMAVLYIIILLLIDRKNIFSEIEELKRIVGIDARRKSRG